MKNRIVCRWYENQKNVEEMLHWNAGKLKKWERSAVDCFPKNAKILDVGCGMGREAFALEDMGFFVVGIDISEEVIRQVTQLALKNRYEVSFLHYDGHSLPFEDKTFDVVLIWAQTFGLLYGDGYKNSFLKECRRVLKSDGIISFSGHDRAYLQEHYGHCLRDDKFYPYTEGDIYWETFSPRDLSDFAQRAGFSVSYCERAEVNRPEDGVVLHCLARKRCP